MRGTVSCAGPALQAGELFYRAMCENPYRSPEHLPAKPQPAPRPRAEYAVAAVFAILVAALCFSVCGCANGLLTDALHLGYEDIEDFRLLLAGLLFALPAVAGLASGCLYIRGSQATRTMAWRCWLAVAMLLAFVVLVKFVGDFIGKVSLHGVLPTELPSHF